MSIDNEFTLAQFHSCVWHYFYLQAPCLDQGQSYKTDFGIIHIKNGFNELNFTFNFINFVAIYAQKVL